MNKKVGLSFKNAIAWTMEGVIAFVVMRLEFPLIPIFPFLKMDFSDVIVAIGTFVFGPLAGIVIALIRSLLSFIISGANPIALISQSAAFLATVAFVLPIYYTTKKYTNKLSKRIIGAIIATLSLVAIMITANVWFLMPIYSALANFNFPSSYILWGIIPFNLIKGLINSVVIFAFYKSVIPPLKSFVEKRF